MTVTIPLTTSHLCAHLADFYLYSEREMDVQACADVAIIADHNGTPSTTIR